MQYTKAGSYRGRQLTPASLRGAIAAMAFAGVLVLSGVSDAAPAMDPTAVPALESRLAERSVLVAVTRVGTRLVAVGERGHVLYSDDSGGTWRQAAVPVRVTLTAVAFVDDKVGWAVGHLGCILRTEDGGATWTKQLDGNGLATLLSGGSDGTTSQQSLRRAEEARNQPFMDILVRDRDQAIVVGAYGLIVATSDGGRSWQPGFTRIGPDEDRHFYSLRAIGSAIYLTGERGLLYVSRDSGRTFQRLEPPAESTFFAIVGVNDDIMLLSLRGRAFRSENGGRNWRAIDFPATASLNYGVPAVDGRSFLIVDGSGNQWRFARDDGRIERVPSKPVFPFSALSVAPDGTVLLVGAGGFARAGK